MHRGRAGGRFPGVLGHRPGAGLELQVKTSPSSAEVLAAAQAAGLGRTVVTRCREFYSASYDRGDGWRRRRCSLTRKRSAGRRRALVVRREVSGLLSDKLLPSARAAGRRAATSSPVKRSSRFTCARRVL
jgi:hypothetical protein